MLCIRGVLRRSFAKLMRGIETGNMFSFPVLKMFCPFPWSHTGPAMDASHVLLSRPPKGHATCPSVESDGQLSLVVKVFLISFFFSC